MRTPPMWRVIAANAVIWIISLGLFWRVFNIKNGADIPISARYDTPLSPELASLLAVVSFACAVWSLILIKNSHWRIWTPWTKIGVSSAIAGMFMLGFGMAIAAYRISEITALES